MSQLSHQNAYEIKSLISGLDFDFLKGVSISEIYCSTTYEKILNLLPNNNFIMFGNKRVNIQKTIFSFKDVNIYIPYNDTKNLSIVINNINNHFSKVKELGDLIINIHLEDGRQMILDYVPNTKTIMPSSKCPLINY